MESYYISFDAGTQSVKVAVYNYEMQCVAKAANNTSFKYPNPGWVEMDADEYFSLTKLGIKQCIEQMNLKGIDSRQIKAVSGDGIICGIVGIDKNGKAVTPYINYLDSRTQEDAEKLNSMDYEIFERETGNADVNCMFPALKARWFLENNEQFKMKGKKFVHNAPYILMNLAGLESSEAFIDWGTMSGWGLGYKIYDKEWSDEQLDILKISKSYMPKIVKPWTIIGTLSKEIAEEIGCPSGIPICAGAGDTMQSIIGSGVFVPHKCIDVAGTCSMFCIATEGIVPGLTKKGSGLIFNSGTIENTYFYWGFVRTGGLALRWFKDNICKKDDIKSYYNVLSKNAEKVSPGSEGLVFLPYLTGSGRKKSDIKGCFINMTLDTDQFTLWRSILESIAYEYKEIVDMCRKVYIPIDEIIVTEGGSCDLLWNQIKSDIMNSKIITLKNQCGALMVNAIVAAYSIGNITNIADVIDRKLKINNIYKPDIDNLLLYEKLFEKRKNIIDRVFDIK